MKYNRCWECGRFSKEETCSKCLMSGDDYTFLYEKPKEAKSNHQIYTEMVEWMYFNDDEQSETAYRIDLLAKLKELLNV